MNKTMKTRFQRHTLYSALFCLLVLFLAFGAVFAQTRGRSAGRATAAGANRVGMPGPAGKRLFLGPKSQLPSWVTRRVYTKPAGRGAANDSSVARQTILLTRAIPADLTNLAPAPSQQNHPFWSTDEKYIYFDSDRASAPDYITAAGVDDTTERVDKVHNIFRMSPDGTGVQQITTGLTDKVEPTVAANRMAYVTGSASTGYQLYLEDLNIQTLTPLTSTNASGLTFSDVHHPSFSPNGSQIVFAGKLTTNTKFHIFVVNVDTGFITQFTNPGSDLSNDYAPAWSPSGSLIAFATNGVFIGPSATAASIAANDDIWVISSTVGNPMPKQITNVSVTGIHSSNKNPAWSSYRADPLGIVPQPTGGNGTIGSQEVLAFASNRADSDITQPGIPTAIVNTFDIYFLRVADEPSAGQINQLFQEIDGNPATYAHKLATSTPDNSLAPSDPSHAFDPNFTTNEDWPTWPQYINSYRIAFQSDRNPTSNLYASSAIDIDAPILLRFDTDTSEVLRTCRASNLALGVREFSAGESVHFRARIADYQSGVSAVYLQIKCPNSAPQSADGLEHKIYGLGLFEDNNRYLSAPYEWDCQAIDTKGYTFRGPNTVAVLGNTVANPLKVTLPHINGSSDNTYRPGADSGAMTGNANPPDTFWLRLYDDGNGPTGHETAGEPAGDGIFSGDWVTPGGLPSDWVVDVVVYDSAIDPFDPTRTSNWKLYDNVWGFTTQPFNGSSNMLYVNDYDAGQKFFRSRLGTSIGFLNGYGIGAADFNGYPCESWMTEVDPDILSKVQFWEDTTNGSIHPVGNGPLNGLGYGGTSYDLTNVDGSNHTGAYDQWRILCRGPVPDSVLSAYAPHIEVQPADKTNGQTTPKFAVVAEKYVFWHAPYTGDLFIGPGTLLDADTQTKLTTFVSRGGRLAVNGQDIAFALTLAGTSANGFLANVLKASYVQDFGGVDYNAVPGITTHPISTSYTPSDPYFKDGPVSDPPSYQNPPTPLHLAAWNNRNFGDSNQLSPDGVTFTNTQAPGVGGVDASGLALLAGPPISASNLSAGIMWSVDAVTHSKVVFSSFGWEGVATDYDLYNVNGDPNWMWLRNRRSQLLHNTGDFLRTGRIVGHVRDVNGAAPIAGALVRATRLAGLIGTVTTVGTATTQLDGSYSIGGLEATGGYGIDAIKPGYVTQHATGNGFHGGTAGTVELLMTVAQPGSLSGKVTLLDGTTPVSGITVNATDLIDSAVFTAVSGADGTYLIKSIPASTYSVQPDPTKLTAAGFGASTPASYPTVVVTPNTTISGNDFKLKGTPGTIAGVVTNATTGLPIAGITVTVTPAGGATPLTATTDANGAYLINADPGTYGVIAAAAGYLTSTSVAAIVTTKTTVTVNIALVPALPGSVSGLVTRTSDAQAVAGLTVNLTDANGKLFATGATFTPALTVNGYTYNYKLTPVPSGQTLNATIMAGGYTVSPVTQGVTVTAGVETQGINFSLQPLHVFPSLLSMVSAPYDYTTNVGDLFGIPAADRANGNFRFFAWNVNNFLPYPTAPADTLHIGRGYFMQYTNSLTLTQQGTALPVTPGTPYKISLQPGWNLIGDPFPFSVDFTNAMIQDSTGAMIPLSTAQAGASAIVGSGLWTYVLGQYQLAFELDAWRGYFIRAFQPGLSLVLDPALQINKSVSRAPRFDGTTGSGWKVELITNAGADYAAPAIAGAYPGAGSTFDQYKLETPPAVGTRSVSFTFDHSDWGTRSASYSMDLRSVADSSQTWDLTLRSNVTDQPVNISWPNLASVPRKIDITLTDMATGVKTDLRSSAGITIPAGRDAVVRHYKLTAGRATRRALSLVDVNAQMSDSRGIGRSAAVSYTVTADAAVQVSISGNGRLLRTLESGRSRAAGSWSSTWDLKDDRGAALPAGSYTVEVRAVGTDGRLVRQIRILRVDR